MCARMAVLENYNIIVIIKAFDVIIYVICIQKQISAFQNVGIHFLKLRRSAMD